MAFELAADLVGEQVDDRVEVLGFFLCGNGQPPQFYRHLAMVAIFIDGQNQVDCASTFEALRDVGQLALGILANRVSRPDMAESDGYRSGRSRSLGAGAASFARERSRSFTFD